MDVADFYMVGAVRSGLSGDMTGIWLLASG